jgi:BirA family biotin operon repressor/biotin-[acetyl-CoA-carboxylase] ligase
VGARRESPAIGAEVIHIEETPSTIDEARRLARRGASHGTVVLADRQTAGRGRRGRTWYTVPGKSLAATVILRDLPDASHLGMATMAGALAVVNAAREAVGVQLRTKWPNDVVYARRKLAGTLAELKGDALLLSIGLNINGSEADLPPDLRDTAATLQMVVGKAVDREKIRAHVLAALDAAWGDLLRNPGKMTRSWERLDTVQGASVRVAQEGGSVVEGRALGIDSVGRLRVQTDGGAVEVVAAGDVTLVQTPVPEAGRAPPRRPRKKGLDRFV